MNLAAYLLSIVSGFAFAAFFIGVGFGEAWWLPVAVLFVSGGSYFVYEKALSRD